MKSLIANKTILTYPYLLKEFMTHTDASNVQLGAVITQEGKPLDFYSKNHERQN